MHFSTLTDKGQTTIPGEIRKYLHLLPQDKIVYVPDGDRVYLTAVRGTILDAKGAVKRRSRKPIDFRKLREQMKEKVAQDTLKDLR